jgi:hypothetical protein
MTTPDPRDRSSRSLILAFLGMSAAIVVLTVLARWLAGHRERALDGEHDAAIARARAAPGTPVIDPTLPAGVVEIDLVPVNPEFALERPATIQAGPQRCAWTRGLSASFIDLAEDRRHPVSVAGPYAAEAFSFTPPGGSRGARIAVRAIPIEPARPYFPSPDGFTPERVLWVRTTQPEKIELVWKQGATVVAMVDVPRAPGETRLAGLAGRIQTEWKQQGGHRDVSDRKVDQAMVVVAPTAPFDEIFPVVEAVQATTREMKLGSGEIITVPVFNVTVQPPAPPVARPRAEASEDDDGPRRGPAGKVRAAQIMVSGRLPPRVIERIVAAREGRVRRCYERGLINNPNLQGRVSVRFVIGNDGAISNVQNGGSDLPDAGVVRCVVQSFDDLTFPRPEGGIVTVTFPYMLSPGP